MRKNKRGEPQLSTAEWRIRGWALEEAANELLTLIDESASAAVSSVGLLGLVRELIDKALSCEQLAGHASRRGPKAKAKHIKRPAHVNAIVAAALPPKFWPKAKVGRKSTMPISDQALLDQVEAGRQLSGVNSDVEAIRLMVDAYWLERGMNRVGGSRVDLVKRYQKRLSTIRKHPKNPGK
ncbi:MAG: hypothetical protein KGN16_01065 [Burkholderiales bacterium]|nr:hypothetical protein [Burkholderiales bacterium]